MSAARGISGRKLKIIIGEQEVTNDNNYVITVIKIATCTRKIYVLFLKLETVLEGGARFV